MSQVVEAAEPVAPAAPEPALGAGAPAPRSKISWLSLLAVPLAAAIALVIHVLVSKNEMPDETRSYSIFLGIALGIGLAITAAQSVWPGLRSWLREMAPILAAALAFLTLWEIITSGLRLLPMPYFPSPAGVLQAMVNDRVPILKNTWDSLQLLAGGYATGVLLGVITGVSIGWFDRARYWGMPVLKIIGPIPATAWIPLAMIIFAPHSMLAATSLIALAVWFPVTMLTASGISNTRASYLDVARTLGASRTFLIFRVAIPAAMPNIFIGLFMGLGAAFLTLIVAETVGVKGGLGWYLQWAQGWAEYAKVYAALVVMAAFFSTIMTLLFKVRDRVLVWQKGTIKW